MNTPSPRLPARARRRRARPVVLAGAALVLVLLASGCIIDGSWTSSTALAAPTGSSADLVTCVSEDWCLASNGTTQIWDGSTWSPAPSPPPVPGGSSDGVAQLDCTAVDRCLAIEGQWDQWADFDYRLLAFDGSGWTEAPGIGDVGEGEPMNLSCGAGGCVVIDGYNRVITWDGSTFTQDWSGAGGDFVYTMSCAAIDDCIGLGSDQTFRWDGGTWTQVALGGPDGFIGPALDCPTSDRCVAIGQLYEEEWGGPAPGAPHRILVWDGSSWTEKPFPDGAEQWYADVSCRANLECLAIRGRTVITFNSQDWFVSPTAPGDANTQYADVACVDQTCMAIGRLYPPAPNPRNGTVARYQWSYG